MNDIMHCYTTLHWRWVKSEQLLTRNKVCVFKKLHFTILECEYFETGNTLKQDKSIRPVNKVNYYWQYLVFISHD